MLADLLARLVIETSAMDIASLNARIIGRGTLMCARGDVGTRAATTGLWVHTTARRLRLVARETTAPGRLDKIVARFTLSAKGIHIVWI